MTNWKVVNTIVDEIVPEYVDVCDSGMGKSYRLVNHNDVYVDLMSYDEAPTDRKPLHEEFDSMIGKTVRVTIEVADE